MGKGRTPKTSDTRILLEILLHRDRAVFAAEIAENVDIGIERVRQITRELEADGLITIKSVSNRNLYTLTERGLERLAEDLRDLVN